jgi:very-short-patch-repair endonuclease
VAGRPGWFSTSKRSATDIHSLPELKTFRTKLRKHLTPAEAAFWLLVKNSQLDGRKFRRQHSVGRYILDFYSPSERLAVELDGEVHFHEKAIEYDRERTVFMEQFGIKVLRFENQIVFKAPEKIKARIREEFGWWRILDE